MGGSLISPAKLHHADSDHTPPDWTISCDELRLTGVICARAALRVMEVRKAYCAEDFEWDICRKVAAKDMHEANVRLLRNKAEEAFQRSSTASEGRTD